MLEQYQPLYLKYRPQTLMDLVGQTSVAGTLKNAIEHDRICHAYLFTGPRGTGKTSSARILAKSLNCEKGPTATPCLQCTSCIEIKQSNSPAVFEIDAASNNSVDDARLLIERAPLVSPGGKYKIYIIDECHMLTKEAFNALLKTIEEPPPNVIFILATTEEHKVPATIVSRTQRLMFRLVGQKELVSHLRSIAKLENVEIEDDALELIARRSGGGLRDALGLLDQASLLYEPGKPVCVRDLLTMLGAVHEDVLLQISDGLLQRDGETVLQAAHTLMMEGREPALLVVELAKHFLNLAKANYLGKGKVTGADGHSLILGSPSYINGLLEQGPKFERAELAQVVEKLDALEQTCRRSSQPALNMEIGLVALCHRHDILMMQELANRVSQLEGEVFQGMKVPGAARPVPSTPRPAPMQQNRMPEPQAPAPQRTSPNVPSQSPRPVAAEVNAPAPAMQVPPQTVPAMQSVGVSAEAGALPTRSAGAAGSTRSASAAVLSESEPPEQAAAPRTAAGAPGPDDDDDYELTVVGSESDEDDEEEAASPPAGETGAANPVVESPGQLSLGGTIAGAASIATNSGGEGREGLSGAIERGNSSDGGRGSDGGSDLASRGSEGAGDLASRGSEGAGDLAGRGAANGVGDVTAGSTSGDYQPASAVELEELWSGLLDELQRRHLPTFSLVSSQGFPVALEKSDMTIGVKAEHLQKMLENKAEHIRVACTNAAGRPMTVRIRVVGQAPNRAPARGKEKRTASDDDSSEGHGASPGIASPLSHSVPSRATAVAEPVQTQAPAAQHGPVTRSTIAPVPRLAPSTPPSTGAEPGESNLVQQAYKLFEGPGSRLIT